MRWMRERFLSMPTRRCTRRSSAARIPSAFIQPARPRMTPSLRSAQARNLAPEILVGVLNVAAQLLALFRRHLPRPLRPRAAFPVGIAHVFAHALTFVL